MCQELIIKQYMYEMQSWGRMLMFFLQENVSFKTRLSEIVPYNLNPEDIAIAENFQEEFLSQDRTINFLLDELYEHSKLLERNIYENDELFKEVIRNQRKIRKDIKKGEQLFTKIKEQFSEYLNEHFTFSNI